MAFYEGRSKYAAAAAADIRKRPDISRCKRHPKHQQAPGVCSLCLHEKLSKICSSGSRSRSSSSSSSSSSSIFSRMHYYDYSSSSSSSLSSSSSSGSSMETSPVHRYRFDQNELGKSRSVAFVPRRRRTNRKKGRDVNSYGDDDDKGRGTDKRLGFWSRLISSRQGQKTR